MVNKPARILHTNLSAMLGINKVPKSEPTSKNNVERV